MKVKELIHKLTQEWVDQEAEISITTNAGFGTVSEVTTDRPWGKQRVFVDVDLQEDEHMHKIWGGPS